MTRRPSSRPDPTKLLLLAVSIVAALILCEILARGLPWAVLHPPIPDYAWMAYDPLLGMVNVPGFAANRPRIGSTRARGSLAVNPAGFRGPPIQESKPALRIACLGDSSTFGIWLESGHAGFPDADFRLGSNYPARLAHRLRADGIDAEVINAGVLGYHVGHGFRQLRLKILPLRPDIVVLRFGFNEHAFAGAATHVQDPRAFVPRTVFDAVDDLVLTQLLLARVRRSVVIPAVAVERFEETLTSMIARTRAQHATVLLLDYPLRPLAQGLRATAALPFLGAASTLEELHERHARYQEALRTVAQREGVPLVETASALAHTERPVFSDADLVHPNARGAAVIARQLARALRTRSVREDRELALP